MRKHVAWYVKGLPHSARVREQVNQTRTVDEMAELLSTYAAELECGGLEELADRTENAAAGASGHSATAAGSMASSPSPRPGEGAVAAR